MKTRRERNPYRPRGSRQLDADMLRILAMIGHGNAAGLSPSYQEIKTGLNRISYHAVQCRIARLERLGLVAYDRSPAGHRCQRAVRLTCRLEAR